MFRTLLLDSLINFLNYSILNVFFGKLQRQIWKILALGEKDVVRIIKKKIKNLPKLN